VLPTLVPLADPMARTSGVTNRIEVRGHPVGGVAFSGPGAGGPATASAVLGDLLAIARGAGSTWSALPPASLAEPDALAGPPESAEDRGWFVVASGPVATAVSAIGKTRTASAIGASRTARVPGATAVHVPRVALADLLARLRAAGAPTELVIFPADVRAARR
jgi:hypothetical protein